MRILQSYLVRQVLITLLMAVGVFTFVLLLGNLLKEILAMLVNRQATLGTVAYAVALLVPFVLPFALPLGLLTGTLLVFGRFSADNELTAARASGVSLVSLVAPLIVLATMLSGVCAWLNLEVTPVCRQAYKDLIYEVFMTRPTAPFVSGRFITDFPGFAIYAGKVDGTKLEDVLFYKLEEGEVVLDLKAPRATVQVDAAGRQLVFQFPSALILYWMPSPPDTNAPVVAGVGSPPGGEDEANPRRKGYWQPLISHDVVEHAVPFDPTRPSQRAAKYNEMTFRQLLREKEVLSRQGIQKLTPLQVQIHRKVAVSFACISFTLVGIPLGIRAHRRETTAGIAIALLLALVYYAFVITGEALDTRAELYPYLILWAPNFLFHGLGGYLLWRANRG